MTNTRRGRERGGAAEEEVEGEEVDEEEEEWETWRGKVTLGEERRRKAAAGF